jgi:uncharacterized membrane protein
MAKKRSNLRTAGIVTGVAVLIAVILSVLAIFFYGGYLTGGTEATHTENVDYSHYAWYLMLPLLAAIALVIVSVYLLTKVDFGKKKNKTATIATIWIVGMTLIAAALVGFFGYFFVRAYSDSAEVSDIKLETNAGAGAATISLDNYTILSASVEEYHARDESHYDTYRLITFDDMWRIAIRVNNTANWNSTNQNLTGVTATLQGYAMPAPGATAYVATTGLYAPNTQIGATTYADIDVLVFEGVQRDPRIVSFELKILDSDGGVLALAYIHPAVELSEMAWFMNTDLA